MSCWVVIRYQADFKARYDALRERGKSAKVALIACMRILLIRLNAMLRDGTVESHATAVRLFAEPELDDRS